MKNLLFKIGLLGGLLWCIGSGFACSVAPRYRTQPTGSGAGGDVLYVEEGIASYYAHDFHGKPTASGEIFDMNKISAAHKELPLGTIVRVTNLSNNRSIVLKVNDRGPFVKGRILDCSLKAAEELDFIREGTVRVRIEVLKWGGTS